MKYFGRVFLVLLMLLPALLHAQWQEADSILTAKGELVIQFQRSPQHNLGKIGKMLSIDYVDENIVRAYLNRKQYTSFLNLGIPFEIYSPIFREEDYPLVCLEEFLLSNWDVYPTYPAYDSLMHSFQIAHPLLCSIDTIGATPDGHLLLAAVLKGNSGGKVVPQFLYTSTIHGDEITGYVLMLRLIDYLLSNYGSDPRITKLLDSTEIWINPLANPDGTYKGGNNNIIGAIRGNKNFIDLNRNYPDPQDGQHPDQNPWQAETMAFMLLAQQQNFVMSANFHGGAEVVNYPWDTWSQLPADNQWWIMVSKQYADTAQYYSPAAQSYLDDFGTGFINGYTWYSISGGRQDYMNYFHRCREVTIEISSTKKPIALQLPSYWEWNYRSLLNYLEQLQYGVSGVVTDSLSGLPLKAMLSISGHDKDSSHVYSRQTDGYYKRLLYAGSWNLSFSAPGYATKTIPVQLANASKIYLDVALVAINPGIEKIKAAEPKLYPNPATTQVFLEFPLGIDKCEVSIYSVDGRQLQREAYDNIGGKQERILLKDLPQGVFILKIKTGDGLFVKKFSKL